MVFLTFFSILLFSNIVTALSTFFLSRDLDRVVAAPVSWPLLFAGRFGDTIIESSWMVVAFAVPAFLAYGIAHGAGPVFYVLAAAVLPPFLVIPAALGVTCTAVLVNVFPAWRTRDVLVLMSVVAIAVVYLLLRMLQPERLVNPEAFEQSAGGAAGGIHAARRDCVSQSRVGGVRDRLGGGAVRAAVDQSRGAVVLDRAQCAVAVAAAVVVQVLGGPRAVAGAGRGAGGGNELLSAGVCG